MTCNVPTMDSDQDELDEGAQMEKDRAERSANAAQAAEATTQEAREREALGELRAIRKGIEALVAAQEEASSL